LVDTAPEIIGVAGLVNDRVREDVQALELMSAEDAPATASELLDRLGQQSVPEAVPAEDLYALGEELGYEPELKWSPASRQQLDLILRRVNAPLVELAPLDQRREDQTLSEKSWGRFANNPLQTEIARNLVPALRQLLSEKLPEHMMPSAFVLLDAMPLTTNGKLNRRALPPPGQARPELETDYVAPRTPAEETLVNIWTDVLKLKQIGVNDNFFQLGGHSLLATQVISRVREQLQIELPLRFLFDFPTVAGLATASAEFSGGSPGMTSNTITRTAERTAADLLAQIDQLTDEQVEALLSEALAE
jgi:acyl carrier protein